MSFDWHTEEMVEWEEPPQIRPEPEEPSPAKWRRFLMLALFVAMVVLGGFAVYRLLGQQVTQVTDDTESDLLASYTVIENAAKAADGELFATFLSGKDADWARDYEALVTAGIYYDRSPFDMDWLEIEEPTTAVIRTTINPTFDAAEIVTTRAYSVAVGNGFTETARLQHTAVYRLGADRWLLAPPEAAFWGEMLSKNGYYLTLTYPQRDKMIAEKLLLELDTAVATICSNGRFTCPEGFQIMVELMTDPAVMDPQFHQSVFIDRHLNVRLPTPSLIGVPVDEVAYQTLARGYKVQLLNSVLSLLVGAPEQTEKKFLQGWLDWQLAQLGLLLPVQIDNDRYRLLEQAPPITSGEAYWGGAEADPIFMRALFDFMINALAVPQQRVTNSLSDGKIRPYSDWLLEMVDGRYTLPELEQRWQQYLLTL